MEDLYAVLEIGPEASPEEVRAAYRALARRYHPDRNPDDGEAARHMQALNAAYAVLSEPERRLEYDRQRSLAAAVRPATTEPKRGAGRAPRPYYYRGKNWGMHAGAEEPPAHIVRVAPASFNLVATGVSPVAREVVVCNDAPFSVFMQVQCSPWLTASAEVLTVGGGGSATLTIGVSPAAIRDMRGWRDGGVSLDTDDPRVFCPDVRVTAVFLPATTSKERAPAGAPDLRTVQVPTHESGGDSLIDDGLVGDPRGDPINEASRASRAWLRRLLGL
jgi:hypothetical protein